MTFLTNTMTDSASIRRTVRLKLAQGLHMRVCTHVIGIVGKFPGKVSIGYNGNSADASSMFDLMLLAALPDSELLIEAAGDGAEEVVNQLERLFSAESEPSESL